MSLGALPLLAIVRLHASALQISLMAALAAIASAVIAVPLSPTIERLPKRQVLIAAECTQFAAMGSVVLAFAAGRLSYAQLCVVEVVEAAATITYLSAANALIKHIVSPSQLISANARVEATNWTTLTLGPPAGGLLITTLGPVASVIADALSFVLGALWLRSITATEVGEGPPDAQEPLGRRISAGFRHIVTHPGLRGLYLNAMVFGGAVTMTSPLLAVFMLRDLRLAAWQYGLVLGLPAAAGLLGSVISPPMAVRIGERRALLWAGAARGPWILLLVAAAAGLRGLGVILVSQALLLFTAGIFNPVFTTYRMRATPDGLMARVGTAWSVSARVVQPMCIAAGGWIASVNGTRPALIAAGLLCLSASALLPWRASVPVGSRPENLAEVEA
jgi:MFS family permease